MIENVSTNSITLVNVCNDKKSFNITKYDNNITMNIYLYPNLINDPITTDIDKYTETNNTTTNKTNNLKSYIKSNLNNEKLPNNNESFNIEINQYETSKYIPDNSVNLKSFISDNSTCLNILLDDIKYKNFNKEILKSLLFIAHKINKIENILILIFRGNIDYIEFLKSFITIGFCTQSFINNNSNDISTCNLNVNSNYNITENYSEINSCKSISNNDNSNNILPCELKSTKCYEECKSYFEDNYLNINEYKILTLKLNKDKKYNYIEDVEF